MSQSNVIAACLFIAFIVFITMRGKLPAYLAALFGTNAASATGGGGDTAASGADVGAGVAGAVNDPIGAASGAIRRGLGVANGLGSNLGSLLGF